MNSPTFYIQDRSNRSHRKSLEALLTRLGFQETSASDQAHLVIVHANTDRPGTTGGITQTAVDQCLNRKGCYIEYTTDPTATWRSPAPRQYRGNHDELTQRLNCLRPPTSFLHLQRALNTEKQSLSLLCQGYLLAHINPETNTIDTISPDQTLKQAIDTLGVANFVNQNQESQLLLTWKNNSHRIKIQVNHPPYWNVIHEIEFRQQIRYECKGCPENLVSKVENLIHQIRIQSSLSPTVVADAYQAIMQLQVH
jgi:hypothetical protein